MPVGFWNDPDGTRYRESYFEMYPGRLAPRRLDPASPSGGARSSRAARIRPSIGRASGSARASCTASSRASPRSSTAWSSGWSCRAAAIGCRCSWSSPTASSWTTALKAPHQRRDPGRPLATPRPRRDRRGPGRPAHADRQEDGGPGQAPPPGSPAGGGRGGGRDGGSGGLAVVRGIRGPRRSVERLGEGTDGIPAAQARRADGSA